MYIACIVYIYIYIYIYILSIYTYNIYIYIYIYQLGGCGVLLPRGRGLFWPNIHTSSCGVY